MVELFASSSNKRNSMNIDCLLEYLGIPAHYVVQEKDLNPKTCSATDYVTYFIFPTLLPAIHDMLGAVKENLVFENWRAMKRFNPCDSITEYLYNHNPRYSDRISVGLWDIPFVVEIDRKKPRPPLPLSLIWTEEKASTVIQSFWRGYLVRKTDEVQELRRYQKDMRESSYHIMFRVEDFWKQHPIEDSEDETTLKEKK